MSNGLLLRKLLREYAMTQAELAEVIDVSDRTVRNWLRIGGEHEASDRVVKEIQLKLKNQEKEF